MSIYLNILKGISIFAFWFMISFTFITAIDLTKRIVDDKFDGSFAVFELKQEGQKYYFIPRTSSTRMEYVSPFFSIVNGTTFLKEQNISSPIYSYCFIVDNEELAQNLAGGNKTLAELQVSYFLIMLGILDTLVSFLLVKLIRVNSFRGFHKINFFLITSSPKLMTLAFQDYEFSDCAGFRETSTLFILLKFFGGEAYYRKNPKFRSDFNNVLLGFCFFSHIDYLYHVCKWVRRRNDSLYRNSRKAVCAFCDINLWLLGFAYLIINGFLLLAQISNSVQIILSLSFAVKDVQELIILCYIDSETDRVASLPQSLPTAESGTRNPQEALESAEPLTRNPQENLGSAEAGTRCPEEGLMLVEVL